MSVILKITKAIIKKNPTFTIGLIVMFTISIALTVLLSVFPPSINKSLDEYFKQSNDPDATITYNPPVYDKDNKIKKAQVDGITHIEEQKTITGRFVTDDKRVFSSMLYSYPADTIIEYTSKEHTDNNSKYAGCSISYDFAKYNNIHTGDVITFNSKANTKTSKEYPSIKLFITDIINSPTTMTTAWNELSWCDSNMTPFVFIEDSDMDNLLGTTNIYNIAYVYFDQNLNNDERTELMKTLDEKTGFDSSKQVLRDDSIRNSNYNDISNSIKTVLSSLPVLILVLCFLCTFLFVRQVILKEEKINKLLIHLGYDKKLIFGIYLFYIFSIMLFAFIVGLAVSKILYDAIAKITMASYNLPIFCFDIDLPQFLIFIGALVIISLSICVINFFSVFNGYSKDEDSKQNAAEKRTNLKHMAFRISTILCARNKVRFFATSICFAVSVILIMNGVAVFFSTQAQFEYAYGPYLNYDSEIYFDKDSNFAQEITSNKYISGYDFARALKCDISNHDPNDADSQDNWNDSIIVRGIEDPAVLVTPINANKERIEPNDGVIVEESFAQDHNIKIGDTLWLNNTALEVTNLARECVFPILYVDYDTITKISDDYYTGMFVKLKDNVDTQKAYYNISNIKGFENKTNLQDQMQQNIKNTAPIDAVIYLIIFEALLIAIIVVANVVLINIYYRKRDYSIFLILGTKDSFYALCSFFEYLFAFIISSIISCAIGPFVASFMINLMNSKKQIFIVVHMPEVIIIALVVSMLYVAAGTILTTRKIKKIDFIRELNSQE